MSNMKMLRHFQQNKVKEIANQYRKLPLPLKASIWFTLCLFLQKGISLLTTPIIARILSTEEYGKSSLFGSWESIFMILVTLSSDHAILNLCVRHENKNEILSSLMGYNFLIATIWGTIVLAAPHFISNITGMSQPLVICLFLQCTFSIQILCWSYIRQYEYTYSVIVLETLLCTFCTSFGSLLALVYISKTAETKIFFQTIPLVIIGFIISIHAFRTGRIFYNRAVWKYTLFFCVPLIPHYFSERILMSSDRIMINRMCGTSSVAIYSVAYSIGNLITMLTGAINAAFAPYQFHKIKDRDYKNLARNTDYVIGFVAFCLCGIMLFAQEIVWVFGGDKYIESVSIVIPICLGLFFNYLFQLFGRVQEYFEQKYTIVIASISCAVLNILLNFFFIRHFGYQAAAYTTFFCYFIFCFLHYGFYKMACKKYVGQEIYDIKGLIVISIVLIVASAVIYLINYFRYVKYIIFIFMFVLMIREKDKIRYFARMIMKKE